MQGRSHFFVRIQTAAGRLRRQTFVKFTSAHTLVNDHISVTWRAVAKRLPVPLTTGITSAFTPVRYTVFQVYTVLL